MRIPKILGAISTLFIASTSAAPLAIQNSTTARRANTTSSAPHATYLKARDAQWVSDLQLCGNSTRQHAGYINVNNHTDTGVPVPFPKNSFLMNSPEVEKLNMAFWLFEATEYAEHLPLYIIFGGEYGVPVTQSVFGPTGPCQPKLSYHQDDEADKSYFEEGKHGFQRWANTLYIETPIGLGFSYAEGSAVADMPEEEYLYTFLQRFLEAFPQYEQRRTMIQSFDMGAKVATSFVRTIVEHNQAIAQSEEFGKPIELDSLFLISPYLDPAMQISYTRKLSRKNAQGTPWMSKDRSIGFKRDYAVWKAECLGRDFKDEDVGKVLTAYKPCNESQRMERFRKLWHGLMEGYDTEVERFPDIDPFDFRDIRQDRMSEFLYHRTTRPQLEKWLQDRENQRRLGFAGFADNGLEYAAFDRAMVDDMLNTTFFDEAPKGLNEAANNGVKVVLVGGDMDAVTNWISLLKLAFQIDGAREFMEAPWVAFDDTVIQDDIFPTPLRHLGDANLKNRVGGKDGGKIRYIMIKDAGHDVEKQDPGVWHDLAMYLAWPQPPAELVNAALDYPPRYEPNENLMDTSEIEWPENFRYEQHEPHGSGHFHDKTMPKEKPKNGNTTVPDPLQIERRDLTRELEVLDKPSGVTVTVLGRRDEASGSAAEPGQGNLNLDMFNDAVANGPSQGGDVRPFDAEAELRALMRGYYDPHSNMPPDHRTLQDILDEFSDSDEPISDYDYSYEHTSDFWMDESDWEGDSDYSLRDWLEEFTLEQNHDEWDELREAVHKGLAEAGYERMGGNSYTSEFMEELLRDGDTQPADWKLDPEKSQKISEWIEEANAGIPDIPETDAPGVDSLQEMQPPNLPGANLPNVPLQAAGNMAAGAAEAKAGKYLAAGQAGAAALGSGASLAGSGASALGGATSGLAGPAGAVAGGIAGGIGAGAGAAIGGVLGSLDKAGGGGDKEHTEHHHHHHDDDDDDDDNDENDKKKESSGDSKKETKKEPAKGNKKENADPKSKPASKPEYTAEPPPAPATDEIEGDEDGDGDFDKTDEKIRKEEKEAFEAKVKKIKEEAHKADDDAKDVFDAAVEKFNSATDKYLDAKKVNKAARVRIEPAEDKSRKTFKNAEKKAKGAGKAVDQALKKIKQAAEAERAAAEAVDRAMKGAVGEAVEAKHKFDVAHNVEAGLREELKKTEEKLFTAEDAKSYASINLDETEKIAEEKDAWDDALTKGHISMEDAVAAVEAAEKQAEEVAEEKANAEGEQS